METRIKTFVLLEHGPSGNVVLHYKPPCTSAVKKLTTRAGAPSGCYAPNTLHMESSACGNAFGARKAHCNIALHHGTNASMHSRQQNRLYVASTDASIESESGIVVSVRFFRPPLAWRRLLRFRWMCT